MMKTLRLLALALLASVGLAHAQPYDYNYIPSPILGDLKSLGAVRFNSMNNGFVTPQGPAMSGMSLSSVTATGTITAADFYGNGSHLTGISTGRTVLAADKTFYVRTPAHAVTFASGSANIGWASHGLSVNDPVVLAVAPNMGVATVTIASPAVVSKTAHGYLAGQPLHWDTTGALPTGLSSNTVVYVIAAGLAADSFEVSLTPGGAAINTTGSQSGTHYISQVGGMPSFANVIASALGNASADMVLSNGNLTASRPGYLVAGTAGANAATALSGKKYYEYRIDGEADKLNEDIGLGFTLTGNTWGGFNYLGSDTHSWGIYSDGAAYFNGSSTSTTVTLVVGGYGRIAVDTAAGKMWFGDSTGWVGDPAAGTGATFTFTPGTVLFPAITIASSTLPEAVNQATVNFGSSAFQYALPTGFSAVNAAPLVAGTPYYVKTVPGANSITLSLTPGGAALGTATLATGSPIYTASTGNDSNDCSAADRAHACLTAQHALDTVARGYDLGSNHALTSAVQLADGIYAENLFFYEPVGSGASILSSSFSNAPTYSSMQFLGNASNASNVVIAPTDLSNVIALNISGGSWVFSGFTVDSTTSGGYMILAAGTKAYAELLTSLRLIAGSGAVGIQAQDGAVIRLAGNLDLTMSGPFGYGFQVFNGSYVDAESQYLHLLNAPSFSDFAYLNNRAAMTFFSTIVGTATGQRFYLQGNSTIYTFGSGATFMPGNAAGFGEPGTFYDGLQGATSGNDSAAATFVGEYGSTCVASGAAVTLTNVTTANVGTITLAHGGDYDFEGNINFLGTAATVTAGQGAISTTSATLPTDGSEVYDGTVTTTTTLTSGIALPRKRVSLNAGASVYFVAQKTFSAGTEKAFGCLNWRRVR